MSDDYVMVPREPTPDMARAGRKAVAAVADKMEAAKQLAVHVIDFWQQVGHTPANEIYRAMIAAAPPAAPAVPLTDEQFADMVAEASLAVDLAANPLKLLAFARAVLSAAPVVREPLTDERAAFEAWVLKNGTNPCATIRDDVGYVVSVIAACWEAWQARAAHGIGGGK